MNCKKIKNQLLLYLDNELPEMQQLKVQQHLASCTDCSKRLKQLENIWRFSEDIEKVEPSGSLWTGIAAKLSARENHLAPLFDFWEKIINHAIPIAATAIIFICVLVGAYLGSPPNDPDLIISELESTNAAKADFIKTSHLEVFDDLPPASVGGVCLSLEIKK
jgi:hypothetical protein